MNGRNARTKNDKGTVMERDTYKTLAYMIIVAFLEILLLLSMTVYSDRNLSNNFSTISSVNTRSTVTMDKP